MIETPAVRLLWLTAPEQRLKGHKLARPTSIIDISVIYICPCQLDRIEYRVQKAWHENTIQLVYSKPIVSQQFDCARSCLYLYIQVVMVQGGLVCGSTHEMFNRQARFLNCHRCSIVGWWLGYKAASCIHPIWYRSSKFSLSVWIILIWFPPSQPPRPCGQTTVRGVTFFRSVALIARLAGVERWL